MTEIKRYEPEPENNGHLEGLYDSLLCRDNEFLDSLREDAQNAGKGIDTGYRLTSMHGDGSLRDFRLFIPKYAITIICARTGGGKTTTMTNLAVRLPLAGAVGMYVTLEEPAFSITAKMLASYSRTVNASHSMQAINNHEALKAIAGDLDCRDMDGFRKDVLKKCRPIDANKTVDTSKIETATVLYQPQYITDLIQYRDKKTGRPLDFVIIDFGQLLECSNGETNSYIRMKSVMMALKNLAGSGIAVIIGAQMKRESAPLWIWDWEPEMIRDGSDMEQAASMIIAVGRDTKEKDLVNRDVIRLLKNRNGPKRVGGCFNIDFAHNYIPLTSAQPSEAAL